MTKAKSNKDTKSSKSDDPAVLTIPTYEDVVNAVAEAGSHAKKEGMSPSAAKAHLDKTLKNVAIPGYESYVQKKTHAHVFATLLTTMLLIVILNEFFAAFLIESTWQIYRNAPVTFVLCIVVPSAGWAFARTRELGWLMFMVVCGLTGFVTVIPTIRDTIVEMKDCSSVDSAAGVACYDFWKDKVGDVASVCGFRTDTGSICPTISMGHNNGVAFMGYQIAQAFIIAILYGSSVMMALIFLPSIEDLQKTETMEKNLTSNLLIKLTESGELAASSASLHSYHLHNVAFQKGLANYLGEKKLKNVQKGVQSTLNTVSYAAGGSESLFGKPKPVVTLDNGKPVYNGFGNYQ